MEQQATRSETEMKDGGIELKVFLAGSTSRHYCDAAFNTLSSIAGTLGLSMLDRN